MKLFVIIPVLFVVSTLSARAEMSRAPSCRDFLEHGKFIFADADFPLKNTKLVASCAQVVNPLGESETKSVPFQALACVFSGELPSRKNVVVISTKISTVDLKVPHTISGLGEFIPADRHGRAQDKFTFQPSPSGFILDYEAGGKTEFPFESKWRSEFTKRGETSTLRMQRWDRDFGKKDWNYTYAITYECE